jgi:hypothetical protein
VGEAQGDGEPLPLRLSDGEGVELRVPPPGGGEGVWLDEPVPLGGKVALPDMVATVWLGGAVTVSALALALEQEDALKVAERVLVMVTLALVVGATLVSVPVGDADGTSDREAVPECANEGEAKADERGLREGDKEGDGEELGGLLGDIVDEA